MCTHIRSVRKRYSLSPTKQMTWDRIDNAIQLVEDDGQNSSTWFYYQALFSNSSDCFHIGEIC